MDNFGVPKTINRHVLKALYYINDFENPEFSEICEIVEITMKNNVPIRNLHSVIRQSLQNMAQLGVIGTNGTNFFVQNTAKLFQNPDMHNSELNGRRNEQSKFKPNSRKRISSEDYLSGHEIEKQKKRMRKSKSFKSKGRDLNDVFTPSEEDHSDREADDESGNDVHLNTENQLISKFDNVVECSAHLSNCYDEHKPSPAIPENSEVETEHQQVEVESNNDMHLGTDISKLNDVIECSVKSSNCEDGYELSAATQTMPENLELKTVDQNQEVDVELKDDVHLDTENSKLNDVIKCSVQPSNCEDKHQLSAVTQTLDNLEVKTDRPQQQVEVKIEDKPKEEGDMEKKQIT